MPKLRFPIIAPTLSVAFALSLAAAQAELKDIVIEAESAKLAAPFDVGRHQEASGGAFIWAEESIPNAASRGESKGSAAYVVDAPAAGDYELWGKVFTPGPPRTREDSFFIDLNGRKLTWRVHDWADNWVWRRFTGDDITEEVTFHLEKGENHLVINHRVSGTQLDQLKFIPIRASASAFGGFDPMTLEAGTETVYRKLSPYFDMPDLHVPQFPAASFSIADFGAKEGGTFNNSSAIAKAIDACAKAGGGRVVVPAGKWLTGPVHLKSNVDFHVSEGATLLFSQSMDDYLPVVFTRWEGMECYNFSAPIYARGQTNIALTGKGLIDGQGKFWWDWKANLQKGAAMKLYQMIQDGVPPEKRVMGDTNPGLRPNLVQFIDCKNVLIENLTFKNGPMWTLHPIYVDGMVVRGVKVTTVGPNNDGINPDSTRNLLVEDCYFSTGDDCIVLKSGLNEDGWRVNKPTENVVIRRVYGNEGHGGIVMGSEMSGGVRNVYAHDCHFVGTDRGIRLKSMRGRGAFIENLFCERIKMSNIGGQAIRINAFYGSSTLKPATQVPPVFRNMVFKDITCDGAARAIEITGLEEEPVRGLRFENVTITGNQGFLATDAEDIELKNVTITAKKGPAYSFNNARDVSFDGVSDGSPGNPEIEIKGARSANIGTP